MNLPPVNRPLERLRAIAEGISELEADRISTMEAARAGDPPVAWRDLAQAAGLGVTGEAAQNLLRRAKGWSDRLPDTTVGVSATVAAEHFGISIPTFLKRLADPTSEVAKNTTETSGVYRGRQVKRYVIGGSDNAAPERARPAHVPSDVQVLASKLMLDSAWLHQRLLDPADAIHALVEHATLPGRKRRWRLRDGALGLLAAEEAPQGRSQVTFHGIRSLAVALGYPDEARLRDRLDDPEDSIHERVRRIDLPGDKRRWALFGETQR